MKMTPYLATGLAEGFIPAKSEDQVIEISSVDTKDVSLFTTGQIT